MLTVFLEPLLTKSFFPFSGFFLPPLSIISMIISRHRGLDTMRNAMFLRNASFIREMYFFTQFSSIFISLKKGVVKFTFFVVREFFGKLRGALLTTTIIVYYYYYYFVVGQIFFRIKRIFLRRVREH